MMSHPAEPRSGYRPVLDAPPPADPRSGYRPVLDVPAGERHARHADAALRRRVVGDVVRAVSVVLHHRLPGQGTCPTREAEEVKVYGTTVKASEGCRYVWGVWV